MFVDYLSDDYFLHPSDIEKWYNYNSLIVKCVVNLTCQFLLRFKFK